MTELLTAAQMRAIEARAIESGEVTGRELMERAGRGVVDAALGEWPELARAPDRAIVLCGPGNNGGDGFVVARLLADRGWQVEVFLYGDAEKLPPDARANYRRWQEAGPVRPLEALDMDAVRDARLLVDAIFGTGLSRPLDADLSRLVTAIAHHAALPRAHVVAIDMPSGFCSDSGRALFRPEGPDSDAPYRPHAHLTVTFERPRLGHHLGPAAAASGRGVVVPLGIAHRADGPLSEAARLALIDPAQLSKPVSGHKYAAGHALVLSGGAGRTGAARLAARGALRIGAGLVTLGVPGAAQLEVAGAITALMLTRVDDDGALAETLADPRVTAVCLGPGLGAARAALLVPAALAAAPRRGCVLDADALTAYEAAPETLFAQLHANCVLTPHAGEFARLFPDIADKLRAPAESGPAYSKVDATRAAAARAGCTVLFKGPDTVIADASGRCRVNAAHGAQAAPWLATAGAGDVLAGFVAGLLARGVAPLQAAEQGAWLHVACARRFGPGLVAEDLPEMLPPVLRELGA